MPAPRSVLLAMCLLLPACAAQTPALKVPSLAAMQRDSVDSVNFTLGPVALGFMGLLGDDHDARSAAEIKLFRSLHEVEIHSFRFATDHTYRQADLETLRSQLTAPGWQHVMQARDRGSDGDVDIYCAVNKHKITRLVIIAAEPREFSLINIAGAIEPDQIGMLHSGFVPDKDGQLRLAPTRAEQR